MSVSEFIEQETQERIGAAASIAALRRAYTAAVGPISRCEFVCALAAGGYTIVAPSGRPSYLVGRALAKQPAAA